MLARPRIRLRRLDIITFRIDQALATAVGAAALDRRDQKAAHNGLSSAHRERPMIGQWPKREQRLSAAPFVTLWLRAHRRKHAGLQAPLQPRFPRAARLCDAGGTGIRSDALARAFPSGRRTAGDARDHLRRVCRARGPTPVPSFRPSRRPGNCPICWSVNLATAAILHQPPAVPTPPARFAAPEPVRAHSVVGGDEQRSLPGARSARSPDGLTASQGRAA